MKRKRRRFGPRGGRSSLEHICDELAASVQRVKTKMCRRHAGPIDAPPMLFHRLDGEDELRITDFSYGHPVTAFPLIWERILDEGNPDFVAVVTESYIRPHGDGEVYRRGQYERDFKENPFSDVKEAVLITGVDLRQGRHRNTVIPFSYDDRGMPRFTRYPWRDDCGGNLGELLADCVRQMQRRTGW